MSKHVVLGAEWCPFCVKVFNYFKQHNIPFRSVDTDSAEGAKERTELSKKHNWKTIPMVFVDGQFIGGCDDFFAALKQGKINL